MSSDAWTQIHKTPRGIMILFVPIISISRIAKSSGRQYPTALNCHIFLQPRRLRFIHRLFCICLRPEWLGHRARRMNNNDHLALSCSTRQSWTRKQSPSITFCTANRASINWRQTFLRNPVSWTRNLLCWMGRTASIVTPGRMINHGKRNIDLLSHYPLLN